MAARPNLPDGSSERYQELFNALADDDARRGYLLYLEEYGGKLVGAGVLSRQWNNMTPAAQAPFINRAVAATISDAPSSENKDNKDSPEEDPPDAIDGGHEQADPAAPKNSIQPVGEPPITVANPSVEKDPDASDLTNQPEYEPSDEEIAVARVGLTEANTGRAQPPRTRKRGRDEAHDDQTEQWQWCKTLMDSHTRFSGSKEMRTVVCLYALCDDNGIILQRKVCKKLRCGSQETVNHVKDEYDTSQQLQHCDHCHHIQAASQQDGTLTYRLYSDYAEHGDLRELLKIYYQTENLDRQIPEQFIWMVFHALADAIGTMNTGECGEVLAEEKAAEERENNPEAERQGPKTKQRKRVAKKPGKDVKNGMVHLDIKPENIFLNTAKAPYLAYPKSLLADYDVVKMIAPETDVAEGRRDWGTKGFQAPEIIVESAHHHPVNAKVDIWSLGMVIWKMMHTTLGRERSDQICEDSIKASFQFADGNTFTSTDIPGYDAMYSNTLHQLVIDCLKINPEKRPSYEGLRRKAKAEFGRSQRRLGPVQSEVKDGGDVAIHLRVLRGEETDYQLGQKFEQPPRKRRKIDVPAQEDAEV